jgi:hypothetical protein
MTRSFSLYPPAVAFVALVAGIGLLSIPAALIVAGALGLGGWLAFFISALRRAS